MNEEENIQLTYASIIQLKDTNNIYQNQYFFIFYICKDFIDVISYPDLNEHQFIIDNNTLKEKKTETIITEIISIFKPSEGYAEANRLFPGKIIDITYLDNTNFEILRSRIIDLIDDMIVIKNLETEEILYIDFQYAGLNKSVISSIKIVDNDIKSKEVHLDNSEIFIYDIEQQVDDYINKMLIYNKNKKKSIK